MEGFMQKCHQKFVEFQISPLKNFKTQRINRQRIKKFKNPHRQALISLSKSESIND